MPVSNEPQHFKFSTRKIVVSQVLCEPSCYLGGHIPTSSVNRTDHAQKLIFRHAFEDVSGGSGPERTLNFAITVGGSQKNDARLRKLAANRDERASIPSAPGRRSSIKVMMSGR